ncbi:efflux RND transporter permease subunit [Sinomicrobium weinanense]|uniref:Efflux RND transporter permease subunit n=1 Tax=Sinomicrobium weinanense TaxID=2842200 RepID=A0A926JV79_9FLAO|nr:efflux RND transporter permease subunit [Sinomicrobium weinanense]MBC9797817.1 efflux RND transporter permease subunit [Sinomicrobium weinanense]MBU3125966.1 efflux RND transporter permease subunit [Sinomicrobium weinanense]
MSQKVSTFRVITIFICLAIVGGGLIPLLSIQLVPSRSLPAVYVSYSWPAASAKVIEQKVTSKLEGLFNSMRGVKEISSTSRKGNGDISIQFKKNTDMDAVRFEMAALIRQSYPQMPEGVSYPFLSLSIPSENNSSVLSYSVNANESSYYIKKYVDHYILPRLSNIKGVSQVGLYGVSPYEWVVTYNADKLSKLGLTVDQVTLAINTFLKKDEIGKGTEVLSQGNSPREIRILYTHQSQEEFNWNKIPVAKSGGRIIYMEDIASVRFKERPPSAYYRINGSNTVNLVIYPEKGVNTIELSKRIKRRVEDIRNELPVEYHLKLTQDTTAHLIDELLKIQWRTLFSLIILLALSIVIYRNTRYVFVLFSSIFINFFVAVIFYYLLQVELQLYSFAGITISFGIIIDNTIIMMDHFRHKGNKKAFLAILAATLTTIGAITVIFLLEESQRINLWDFALVIAINLGVSLLVALYLTPALLEKFKITHKKRHFSRKRKKRIVWFTSQYEYFIIFLNKPMPKWGLIIIMILGFGLPLHLAPKQIESKGLLADLYNQTMGNGWFEENIRPAMEKIVGGSLRLFTENVFEKSYYQEPQKTTLNVTGTMPEGSTIEQLNKAILKMENYIASFKEVELFETQIKSYNDSRITIHFKDEYESGAFPYVLKSLLETKAVSLGGLDWNIYGVGRGFSNALNTGYLADQIVLEGYNYDELYQYSQRLRDSLLVQSKGRVKEIEINTGEWFSKTLYEYHLEFEPQGIALAGITESQVYNTLKNQLHSANLSPVIRNHELQEAKLVSDQHEQFTVWDLKNTPVDIDEKQFKLHELTTIEKRKTGNDIKKVNQQYHLVVAFEFIGPRLLAEKFKEERIQAISNVLPVGYKVFKRDNYGWNKEEKKQYYYIFIIVAIIFFICAILLESLRQPLVILSMIPISFIGVFLTFYFFEFNFDQGGYASFILLCGISVNAALYIVNDFNNLKRHYPGRDIRKLYFKAYNHKILPVFLTIISTIAGLLPFVWGGQREVFWFSFAVGSIGGLIFSLLAILLYLPLFLNLKNKERKVKND